MRTVPIVKVFISSPGDVQLERQRADWVIKRLNGEFREVVEFRPILYEEKVYTAQDGGFQAQIEQAPDCEIVLTIFWGRLGTPLPDSFPQKMEGDKVYPSGTAYELLTSLARRRETGKHPDVFVFRKTTPQTMPEARAELDEMLAQRDRLDQFFSEHFELSDRRILRAVERFAKTDEFETKVEKLLREWIKTHAMQPVTWPVETKGTPFRGLEPFDARHAEVYFGRERKIQRALDELLAADRRGSPFLLIPGASGAGKSSMMRAGLAPRIVQPGTVPEVDVWRTAIVRPGTEKSPLLALARSLFVRGSEKDDPGGFGQALPELAEGSFRDAERLAKLMEAEVELAVDPIVAVLDAISAKETQARRWERPVRTSLLLLVDQFEELFSESVSAEDRARFANLLQRLIATRRVWVIATLRGDMYERMITERPFIALKDSGGQYDLSPPGFDELDEIIHRSAQAAGLSFEEKSFKDETGAEKRVRLDDRLLKDALSENTLPLLQFALNQIFERCWGKEKSKVLTFQAYEEIGGIDGSIERTAEDALTQLVVSGALDKASDQAAAEAGGPSLSSKEIAERVDRQVNPILESLLRRLVVPVGREWDQVGGASERALTARMVPLSEARRNDPWTLRVIDALLAARVLLVTGTESRSLLRIAHDRVLVSWKRAQKLIEKNRSFYRIRDAVEQARIRWEEGDKLPELLLPPGAPVTQAKEMLADYECELSSDTRTYIRRSMGRAEFWRRVTLGLVGLFASLAIAATGSAIFAWYKTGVAESKTLLAVKAANVTRGTIDQVITGFCENLRDVEGINVKAVEAVLKVAEDSVAKLERENGKDDETVKIRANMHYDFAKVFQNSTLAEKPLQRALAQAQAAFAIRSDLAAKPDAAATAKLDHANSFDQIGDILREIARDLDRAKNPEAKEKFVESRAHFDQAYAIRNALLETDAANPDYCFAVSQSLIRLGDCKDWPDKNAAEAYKDYERALDLAARTLRSRPDDVKYHRELTWPLGKLAFLVRDTDVAKSVHLYELATDIRQLLTQHDPGNTLWKRDLAFSLVRLSEPYADQGDVANAEKALLRALVLRSELVATDRNRPLWKKELSDGYRLTAEFMLRTNRPELAIGFFVLADDAPGGPRVAESLEQAARRPPGKKQGDLQRHVEDAKALIAQKFGEEAEFFKQCRAKAADFEANSRTSDAQSQADRLAAAQRRWQKLIEELKSKDSTSLALAIYQFIEAPPAPLAEAGSSGLTGQ